MSVISIKDLNLHYGDFHALKSVNMEIPKNEITAFIGPSGCAKSDSTLSVAHRNGLYRLLRGTDYGGQYHY